MSKDEALKMAIEALKDADKGYAVIGEYDELIQACKEALEQPATTYEQGFAHGYEAHRVERELEQPTQEPAYQVGEIVNPYGSNIKIKQPAQEPVAWMDSEGRFRLDYKTEIVRSIAAVNKEIPLYINPAPSWQGLSDDEIEQAILSKNKEGAWWGMCLDIARAIEQALKEKNDGN